jgi:hypothetical protein
VRRNMTDTDKIRENRYGKVAVLIDGRSPSAIR